MTRANVCRGIVWTMVVTILALLCTHARAATSPEEKLPPIAVTIDILPSEPSNVVDSGSGGTVAVAILASSDFDPATIDGTTVNLAGSPVVGQGSLADVNGDGRPDLVVHVLRRWLQLDEAPKELVLKGTTLAGRYIEGSQWVRPRTPLAGEGSQEKLPTLHIEIDVRPGLVSNLIDLNESSANLPVAILGSSTFDPTTIDPATINLAGAPVAEAEKEMGGLQASTTDVNGDGHPDLLVSVPQRLLQLDENTKQVTLRGTMPTGRLFEGTSPIEVNGTPAAPAPILQDVATFSNATPITIHDGPSTRSSPSNITVSDLSGVISTLTVELVGLAHTFPDDVDILLVGPTGESVILLSDVGGNTPVSKLTLRFSDSGEITLPDSGPLTTGSFQPTNIGMGDAFPSADVASSPAKALDVFIGTNPNGTWSLFAVDDTGRDGGSISGGWRLSVTTATQVCNVGSISIPDSGAATPYPSTISTAGLIGGVSSVTIDLKGLNHTFPDDIDVLLVAPGGQNATIMSDAGGSSAVAGLNLTLSDAAATSLSDVGPLASGTFKPANYEPGDPFSAPAPAPSGGSALSTFNGTNPNGNWRLFVVDDASGDSGSFGGGWCLNVVTPATQFCNLASISIPDSGAGTPYPSNITASGLTGALSCMTVDLKSFNHTFPDDVDVLLVGPAGQNATIMSDVGGNVVASGVNLTLSDAAASSLPDAGPLTSGVFRPANFEPVDPFPAPAPAPSGASALSTFTGTNPNGTWRLYLVDDAGQDLGSLGGGWCLNVVTCSCNDGNPCTTDSCDCATGQCVFTPNNNPCDDGNNCTLNDTCNGGVCVSGPPVDCNDNNPCTDDACSPVVGCVSIPNNAPCDDGLLCTLGDQCSGGTCSGAPRDCNDNVPCSTDTCNPATGACLHTPSAGACVVRNVTPAQWQAADVQWIGDVSPHNKIDDGIDTRPGPFDIIVNYKRCVTDNDVQTLLAQDPGVVLNERNKYISSVNLGNVPKPAVIRIAAFSEVAFIEQQPWGQYLLSNSVPTMCVTPGSPSCLCNARITHGLTGAGRTIVIMDSGVDNVTQQAFAGTTLVWGVDLSGYPTVLGEPPNASSDPPDVLGHGTHVASTALGQGTVNFGEGVAPAARLVDVCLGLLPASKFALAAQRGLQIVYDNASTWGVDVINMSFGLLDPNTGQPKLSDGLDSFSQMVDLAESMNIVTVAAAGNSGPSNPFLTSPAAATRAITVAASNDLNTPDRTNDVIATFTSKGPRTSDGDADQVDELKPDVAAPGVSIVAAQAGSATGAATFSGTSMAAPHVTGLVALLRQLDPTLNAASIKNLIVSTAEPKGAPSNPGVDPVWNNFWGAGLVNACSAITAAGSGCDVGHPNYPANPGWVSVDISTSTPPKVGVQTMAQVNIKNFGLCQANNVKVHFGVHVYSASTPTYHDIGTKTVAIAAGQTIQVAVPWVPLLASHQCLQTEIAWGPDTNHPNNVANRNLTVAQSPVTFAVKNTLTEAQQTINFVPTIVPDPGSPPNWTITINPPQVVLGAEDCDQTITAQLFPPAGAPIGAAATAHVAAMIGNTEIGGISFTQRVNCSPQGSPCNDDLSCTTQDTCSAGSCHGTALLPAETGGLVVNRSGTTAVISWTPGANATGSDVLRGNLGAFPVGPGFDDEVCLGNTISSTMNDTFVPAAGTGVWYLVRGTNTCAAPGTYGNQGVHGVPGAARVSTTCP